MIENMKRYVNRLNDTLNNADWHQVEPLAEALLSAALEQRQVFICGNGGSAGNAIHLANDFLYGIEPNGGSLRVEALPANSAVVTCLGNDIGYENIFSHQLKVKAQPNDVLIILSGSGNSANILNAIQVAKENQVQTFAILGFDGGKAKLTADHAIHFAISDMQISEDLQLIVGHMLMQHLNEKLKVNNVS